LTLHNFAVIGAGGYIAPRHLQAIYETGNRVIAAVDPRDSVGLLDRFGFDIRFFTEIERFERHLHKRARGDSSERAHFVSICSPNYLHDAHCRLALRVGADVICEKPLVINPWNLDPLIEMEAESGRKINSVLQLRLHPQLIDLKRALAEDRANRQHDVVLTNVTGRGPWYHVSWKGDAARSGGLATNIGIHFFDLLIWLFGPAVAVKVHARADSRLSGFLELERARVRWFLSVDATDLPGQRPAATTAYRSIRVDGRELDFGGAFGNLHTRVYEEILAGRGFGIQEARPSIELTHKIRTADVVPVDRDAHPRLVSEARS
jgi:UDP-N-acetyl-2-amino-2-deoxyglucuronate dehydrogenase